MPKVRRPQVYRVEQWGAAAAGASDTRQVTIHGYAKVNSPAGPYCVFNEYVCGRLGQLIHLPIPPGAIVEGSAPDTRAWMTLSFSPVPLPPVDPKVIVREFPSVSADLVAFDILIGNIDRHTSNLAYLPTPNRLEVFDHSHALVGTASGNALPHLATLVGTMAIDGAHGARHCLLDHLSDGAEMVSAIDRVRSTIREVDIKRICDEAGLLELGLTKGEARQAADWLIKRKQTLGDIVAANRASFTGIASGAWPLLT